MKPAVFIVGPTASGKTSAGVELALLLDAEIVSADAISIYAGLDIGSAKPTQEERKGVTHHLLGEIEPDAEFSVSKYRRLALERIGSILEKGKVPVIVGGTGLYVHALLHDMDFANSSGDAKFRENALKRHEADSGCLYRELESLDPEAARRIHPNDLKRVVRALEIAQSPQKRAYDFNRSAVLPFEPVLFGLALPRDELYRRIDERVDGMMRAGLLEEVTRLRGRGYSHLLPAMQGLGYRQIYRYLRGECTLEEAVETIKRDTRRFAKRQITWFKRENVHWLEAQGRGAQTLAREMRNKLFELGIL